ncbi:CHK domain-containing protein [Trichostrongylus colubriformis]|uniref:CHK domain-containing protein n=1 Tax=Trichostrongylus colubriformis TaxID=6319 RepID=A0AAN8FWH3_TRICO
MERVCSMLPAKTGSKLASQLDQLRTILPKMVDLKWADNLAFKCALRRVLCHGDLCPSNTLWRENGEVSELVAVLDYQTAHFGCAATDLVQIFVMFLSGKNRRSHWEELTEEFYDYLRKEVSQRRMPYTLEQVKEAYLQFFPTGAITLLPFIAPLFKLINENVQDKQKKKEFLDRLTEKTECLLEDLLNCYERNAMTHKKKQSA